jgi:transcriptional regulator with XRE-family HTH domain
MRKSTHTTEYAHLRERLTELRAAAGLSQRALAAALNVPHSWVAKVESGDRRIDLVEFAWFCAACGAAPEAEATALLGDFANRPIRKRGGGR